MIMGCFDNRAIEKPLWGTAASRQGAKAPHKFRRELLWPKKTR